MLKVLTLSTILSVLLSSCTTIKEVPKTEYIVRVPEKMASPVAPTLIPLDPNKSLEDKTNFRNLQLNFSLLNNYIDSLRQTVNYYESSIDRLNELKTNGN